MPSKLGEGLSRIGLAALTLPVRLHKAHEPRRRLLLLVGIGIVRLGMRFERFEVFGHIDRAPVDA